MDKRTMVKYWNSVMADNEKEKDFIAKKIISVNNNYLL